MKTVDLNSLSRARLLAALAMPGNQYPDAQALLRAALEAKGVPIPSSRDEGAQGATGDAGDVLTLVLPLPPSVNSYWRSVPASRNRIARVLISEQGRRFKAACRNAAAAQCRKPLAGDISIRCIVYFKDRRRDLDNVLKPLLDALNGIAYGDDRQVAHLEFTKAMDPKRPRVELTIAACGR